MASTSSSDVKQDGDDERIKLSVFCPVRPSSPGKLDTALYPVPEQVEVRRTTSVRELKQQLQESIPGGPLSEGQTLIWRGRRLKDDERLGEVVNEQQEGIPQNGSYTLHLSVPPSSWKAVPQIATIDPSNAAARAAAERLAALSTSLNSAVTSGPSLGQSVTGSSAEGGPVSSTGQSPLTPLNLQAPTGTTSALPSPMPSPFVLPGGGTDPSVDAGRSNLLSAMTQAASTSPSPWRTFFIHLHQLSSSQRSEFILKLVSVEAYYAIQIRNLRARQAVAIESFVPEKPEAMAAQAVDAKDDIGSDPEVERQTEALLEGVGLKDKIEQAVQAAKTAFIQKEDFQKRAFGGAEITSQVVTIGGYPFLLQIPKGYISPASQQERMDQHIELERCRAIQAQLNSMLHIARVTTGSYAAAAAAHRSRYTPAAGGPHGYPGIPAGLGAVGVGAQAAARLAGQALPAGATARLAVVINVDEILRLLIPLTFLSVKLGFLIYIFGRHASPTKRYVMMAMAVLWVFWEGVTIRRRRRAIEARRAQNEQVVQAVGQARANAQAGPAHAQPQEQLPEGHLPPLQPGQVEPPIMAELRDRQRGERRAARVAAIAAEAALHGHGRPNNPQPRPHSSRHSSHRPPPNRLSPKYWMQTIAKVGLAAEAREMGISRSSHTTAGSSFVLTNTSNGQQTAGANQQQAAGAGVQYRIVPRPQRMTPQRILRTIMVFVVLFLGTLIPEIERMRKKYLEKRQKKITELENARTAAFIAREREIWEREEQRNGNVAGETQRDQAMQAVPAGSGSSHNAAGHDHGSGSQQDSSISAGTSEPQSSQMAPQSSDESASSQHMLQPETSGASANVAASPAELDVEPAEPNLFDPPFDEAALAAAFGEEPPALTRQGQVEHQPPRPGGSVTQQQKSTTASATGLPAAGSNGRAIPPNSLRVGRASDNDSMHLGVNADDISTPTTPLLSPAEPETEDEDDRADGDGVDDEVGMILF